MTGELARTVAHAVFTQVSQEGGALVDLATGASLLDEGVPPFKRVVPVAERARITSKELRKILWENRKNEAVQGCDALGVMTEHRDGEDYHLVSYMETERGAG